MQPAFSVQLFELPHSSTSIQIRNKKVYKILTRYMGSELKYLVLNSIGSVAGQDSTLLKYRLIIFGLSQPNTSVRGTLAYNMKWSISLF